MSTICKLLIFLYLFNSVELFVFKDAHTDNIKFGSLAANIQTLSMDENNEEGITLVLITGVTSEPTIEDFLDGSATDLDATIEQKDSDYIIVINKQVDYEALLSTKRFLFRVADSTMEQMINLEIINVDDNPPSISTTSCSMKENTTYTVDNAPCSFRVTDVDGFLDKMTFTIKPSDKNEDEMFEFQYKSSPADDVYGADVYLVLQNGRILDFETVALYVFTLQAKDSAGQSTEPLADIPVLVQVIDIPDEYPVWESFVSLRSFPEEQETTFTVRAKDGDYSINAEINYSVQDPNGFTTINTKTGEVLIAKIDRDIGYDTINLTITAYEAEDRSSFITQDLTFVITDINDNIPKITIDQSDNNKLIDIEIDENYSDRLDIDININDIDLSANAMYTVRLVDRINTDFTSAFQIIPNKGYQSLDFYISVLEYSKLDYEDPDWRIIEFTLEAYDDQNNTMNDLVPVTIRLRDLNDESPKFDDTEGRYRVTVPENIDINKIFTTVHATDKDEGDIVTHSLVGGTANSILIINAETGEIQTKLDRSFDYEKQSEIFVQVLAEDKAQHKTTAELTITVTDINDEPPTLIVSSTTTIKENQKNDYQIPYLNITASDVDTTADLEFSINWDESYATKNSIRIDDEIFAEYHCINVETIPDPNTNKQASAKLTIAETKPGNTPDFEIFDTLFLLLEVTDKNTEEGVKTLTTTIVIKIENINDNPPEFSTDTIETRRSVTENSDININVGTVTASDPDNLKELFYSIEGTDDATKNWITINNKTGALLVSGKIDCDEPKRDSINYKITAFDGDFSTTVQVTIQIHDQNDNRPKMDDINVSIPENSPSGTIVHSLIATDNDRDESFRTVTYKFSTTDSNNDIRNNFEITRNDAGVYQLIVGATANIDREEGPIVYEFNIICEDNPQNIGIITNQKTVKTTIIILDENDNTPIVITTSIPPIKENVLKNQAYDDVIEGQDPDGPGYFSAIDFAIINIQRYADPDYRTDITGDLSQNLFSLSTDKKYKSKKATLQVNGNLKDLYGYYKLTIQTNDFDANGKPENYKNDNVVNLEVKKYNFKEPTFIFPVNDGDDIYLSNQVSADLGLWLWNQIDRLPNIQATDNQNDKYNIKFTLNVTNGDDQIFRLLNGIGQSQAELHLTTANFKEHHEYIVEIAANIDPDNSPETNEKSYTVTRTVKFHFIDLHSEPIFETTIATIQFTENADGLKEQQKIPSAIYDDAIDIPRAIYYILLNEHDYQYFNVNQTNGIVTLKTPLDYEEKESMDITIQASNSGQIDQYADDNTRLKVTINVIDINDNPPIFKNDDYYGGIKTTYPLQTAILVIQATDADMHDKLKYNINTDTMEISDSSLSTVVAYEPFILADVSNGVELRLNFIVQINMKGYFTFTVSVQDQREPQHTATTAVVIFIVSDDDVVNFKFENPLGQVQNQLDDIKTILSEQFNAECVTETPNPVTNDGAQLNQTIVPVYFIDINTKQPIDKDTIFTEVSDISFFSNVRAALLEKSLILMSFDSTAEEDDDVETILRAWLIGVSVCLGTLCLILLLVFFLKTRSLKQRIENLSTSKFGSQDSGLNRQGIAAPTTNKHAIEGSNPIYNNEIDPKEIDRQSIRSGDSELIGVEELAEFNYDTPAQYN